MSSKIRIAARLRPRIPGEIEDDTVSVQREEEGSLYIAVLHPRDQTQRFRFPFSSCYDQTSTQEEIYENDVKPLIDVVFSGVTVTVFAYGVTSSGKTHTMQGSKSEPGIIPRVVKSLFQRRVLVPEVEVSLSVSYMEIYKDDVFDLLYDRESAPKLPIRENESGQVFVANLSSQPLSSIEEFEGIYAAATRRRSTGSTNLNRASSRSHAILTLVVQMIDRAAGLTMTGKINLVDLAGSENNKLTGNDPSRMQESSAINRSLSVLGQVVHAINQGAPRIPYRDSKLTRILQDALGGTAVGLLICNLAPGAKFRQDTWNTLNFATRTKEIENRPVVNVRDTNPAPRPHFATFIQQTASLPPALLPSGTEAPGRSGRPSLIPTAGPSRLPGPSKGRCSSIALNHGGSGFQSFTIAQHRQTGRRTSEPEAQKQSVTASAMTEQEIDERISKAVELEVARRLEEREKRWLEEEAKVSEQQQQQKEQPTLAHHVRRTSTPPIQEQGSTSLPSGVLTPLLKRHEDLDNELKRRLVELEEKFERENKEAQLADVLSPVSKKKTGRAYVALARAHSEKGNLQVALDLYRKAETYVPDNAKLKERILEIEYAVKRNIDFCPEPKRKKGLKGKRGDVISATEESIGASSVSNVQGCDSGARKTKGRRAHQEALGEATNSPHKHKRAAEEVGLKNSSTPAKKQKREKGMKKSTYDTDNEELTYVNAPR